MISATPTCPRFIQKLGVARRGVAPPRGTKPLFGHDEPDVHSAIPQAVECGVRATPGPTGVRLTGARLGSHTTVFRPRVGSHIWK